MLDQKDKLQIGVDKLRKLCYNANTELKEDSVCLDIVTAEKLIEQALEVCDIHDRRNTDVT